MSIRISHGEAYDVEGGGLSRTHNRWERMRNKALYLERHYGTDRRKRMRWHEQEPTPEYEDGKTDYTNSQLQAMADDMLRADSKTELCRTCGERGEDTGEVRPIEQPVEDGQGHPLVLDFKEKRCSNSHVWYEGEGNERGIAGDDPILFEEHFQSRRKREIYTTQGTPDPEIVSGLYNRVHPQGRKVNSAEQRKRHGASFYR